MYDVGSLAGVANPRGAGGGKPLPYDAGSRGRLVGHLVAVDDVGGPAGAANSRGAGGGKPLPYDAGGAGNDSWD